MSISTWRKEFYPKSAGGPSARKAPAAHSLRKWLGLLPENLERHGVARNPYVQTLLMEDVTITGSPRTFSFDATTCALCRAFTCDECTLTAARGGVPCDLCRDDETSSPWAMAVSWGNYAPMIHWLRKAVELEQQNLNHEAKEWTRWGKLMDWAQKAARMIFRRGDPRRADAPVVEREASTTLTTGGHYAQAQPVDPLLPEAERQRLRQVLLVGTAANRRERRAAIRQVRRERVAPKRRKHEARGRRAYLRAMSARHEGV